MTQKIKIGLVQTSTLPTTTATLESLREQTKIAALKGISILLFPEAYLGGYPRTCSFGSAIGSRTTEGREQFLQYHKSAVDLGDTFRGEEEAWINRILPNNPETGRRGDGTREYLETVARDTNVFIITGLVEKAGGSLFCSAIYIDPTRGIIHKRRKVQPTGTERLVWAQGSPSTLKAVVTTIKGVRIVMGTAICWENYMPLLRYSLYAQGVNLWLAPTADARDTWESLMKTVACEGRTFVLSCNQCQLTHDLPKWATSEKVETQEKIQPRSLSVVTNGTDQHPLSAHITSLEEATYSDHATTTEPVPSSYEQHPLSAHMTSLEEITQSSHTTSPPPTTESSSQHPLSAHITPLEEPANPEHENDDDNHHNDHTTTSTASTTQQATPATTTTTQTPQPTNLESSEWASRGGSCIIDPMGKTIQGPVWETIEDEIIYAEVDFEDCERGKLDFDAVGHYSRHDAFHLSVDGLVLSPPP